MSCTLHIHNGVRQVWSREFPNIKSCDSFTGDLYDENEMISVLREDWWGSGPFHVQLQSCNPRKDKNGKFGRSHDIDIMYEDDFFRVFPDGFVSGPVIDIENLYERYLSLKPEKIATSPIKFACKGRPISDKDQEREFKRTIQYYFAQPNYSRTREAYFEIKKNCIWLLPIPNYPPPTFQGDTGDSFADYLLSRYQNHEIDLAELAEAVYKATNVSDLTSSFRDFLIGSSNHGRHALTRKRVVNKYYEPHR